MRTTCRPGPRPRARTRCCARHARRRAVRAHDHSCRAIPRSRSRAPACQARRASTSVRGCATLVARGDSRDAGRRCVPWAPSSTTGRGPVRRADECDQEGRSILMPLSPSAKDANASQDRGSNGHIVGGTGRPPAPSTKDGCQASKSPVRVRPIEASKGDTVSCFEANPPQCFEFVEAVRVWSSFGVRARETEPHEW